MTEHGGFAKVYSTILNSTVWEHSIATRMCWIVMLIECNARGYVRCTPFSLARDAGVTKAEAEEALRVLSAPDPNSANTEHEGRRLLPRPGGWFVVSHQKYREFRSESQIREAERKAAWRASKAAKSTKPIESDRDMSRDSASASASASGSVTPTNEVGGSGGKKRVSDWLYAPPGFEPLPSHRAIAKTRGVDLDTELAKFKAHEFGRTCLDWNPRFEKWLYSANPQRREAYKGSRQKAHGYNPFDGVEIVGGGSNG